MADAQMSAIAQGIRELYGPGSYPSVDDSTLVDAWRQKHYSQVPPDSFMTHAARKWPVQAPLAPVPPAPAVAPAAPATAAPTWGDRARGVLHGVTDLGKQILDDAQGIPRGLGEMAAVAKQKWDRGDFNPERIKYEGPTVPIPADPQAQAQNDKLVSDWAKSKKDLARGSAFAASTLVAGPAGELVPAAGGVGNWIAHNAVEGAAAGAVYGGTKKAIEGGNLGDVAHSALTDAATWGAAGVAIPGAFRGLRKAGGAISDAVGSIGARSEPIAGTITDKMHAAATVAPGVANNASKTVATVAENLAATHPEEHAALVAGANRKQVAATILAKEHPNLAPKALEYRAVELGANLKKKYGPSTAEAAAAAPTAAPPEVAPQPTGPAPQTSADVMSQEAQAAARGANPPEMAPSMSAPVANGTVPLDPQAMASNPNRWFNPLTHDFEDITPSPPAAPPQAGPLFDADPAPEPVGRTPEQIADRMPVPQDRFTWVRNLEQHIKAQGGDDKDLVQAMQSHQFLTKSYAENMLEQLREHDKLPYGQNPEAGGPKPEWTAPPRQPGWNVVRYKKLVARLTAENPKTSPADIERMADTIAAVADPDSKAFAPPVEKPAKGAKPAKSVAKVVPAAPVAVAPLAPVPPAPVAVVPKTPKSLKKIMAEVHALKKE